MNLPEQQDPWADWDAWADSRIAKLREFAPQITKALDDLAGETSKALDDLADETDKALDGWSDDAAARPDDPRAPARAIARARPRRGR